MLLVEYFFSINSIAVDVYFSIILQLRSFTTSPDSGAYQALLYNHTVIVMCSS